MRHALSVLAALAGATAIAASGAQVGPVRPLVLDEPAAAQDGPQTDSRVVQNLELVPAEKLRKAVAARDRARDEVRALRLQVRRAERLVGFIDRPTPEGNRELARRYFGAEYSCAAVIINGETGGTWRHDVAYGFRYGEHLIYSGLAFGLGQARPGTKMLRYGGDAASNPLTQLIWFRAYAEARYGSVCAASAHWTPHRSW